MQNLKKDFERLIKANRLGHAYIFFGPGHVSKLNFAKELAAKLENNDSERPLTDCMLVEKDESGTIGIDAARGIKAYLSETPLLSTYKTAIVSHAEALTTEAQNSLLKIAEEPSGQSLLILIVRDPGILLPTLVSRFQKIYFGDILPEDLENWEESVSPEAEKFFKVAPPARKDFVKALVEPEDFNYRAFLDSLIWQLTKEKKRDSRRWHAVLELRAIADATGLNPRLQLLNLISL